MLKAARKSGPGSDVARAWWSLLLLPFAFVGAFAVGEGLIALFGYPVGNERPPLGPGLAATLPALVVFAIPAAVSTWFARRAARQGRRSGWIPAGCLIFLAVAFAVLNLVPMGQ